MMIDLENREYLRIAAYWKHWAVCFVMKNGLAYMVSTKIGKNFRGIAVAISSMSHTKMCPTVDDVSTITEEELEGALYNLKHEKIERHKYFQERSDDLANSWLKWTNKYQSVIDNLALYYAEKMAHCPSPVGDIKIDFENRGYKEVAGYCPKSYVCFEMENGLAYLVDIERKELYVDVHPYAYFNDYGGFFKEADTMPKADLKIAEKILNTAKLPELSEEDIKSFLYWLHLQKC